LIPVSDSVFARISYASMASTPWTPATSAKKWMSLRTPVGFMKEQHSLFQNSPDPLPQSEQVRELAELIARYRVTMNQLTGRMLYLERRFRRSSDGAAELVGGFVDSFIESCTSVPEKPEEWEGDKCYTSDEAYESVRQMYLFARDLRRAAKRIVTIRRHFYRDLRILRDRHFQGESAFDASANLRINQRKQWSAAERKKIWTNSEKRCRYCGQFLDSYTGDVMHVDHIVPVVAGGGDDIENLAASCATCNLKKNAKSEERFLAELLAGAGVPLLDGIASPRDSTTVGEP
jgi:5-methylcytosine-specific restriction endonuclease McrA